MVTVFRSPEKSAAGEAAAIAELLRGAGIPPAVLDDQAPGVPQGVWEVRVPAADSARAEQLIAARRAPEPEAAGAGLSPALDLITVYSTGDGGESESEALTIQSLLQAAGIDAEIAGERGPFPNLAWEVRVAREHAAEARRIIEDARAAGPSAAEEAEAETET